MRVPCSTHSLYPVVGRSPVFCLLALREGFPYLGPLGYLFGRVPGGYKC